MSQRDLFAPATPRPSTRTMVPKDGILHHCAGIWAIKPHSEPCDGPCGGRASYAAEMERPDRSHYHLFVCAECALPMVADRLARGLPVTPAQHTIKTGAGKGRGRKRG